MNKKGMRTLNFGSIVRLEPRLGELFYKAMHHHPKKPMQVWYSEYKPIMSDLVGLARKDNEILRTSEAYDICYFTISSVLGEF